MIEFLNESENSRQLSNNRLNSKAEAVNDISRSIIYSDLINDEEYRNLLKSIPFWYKELNGLNVSKAKINALLQENKFQLTEVNLEFLKLKLSTTESALLVEKNFGLFLDGDENIVLELKEYQFLLDSKNLKAKDKSDLLKSIKPDDLLNEHPLSKLICEYSLKKFSYEIFDDDVFNAIITNEIGLSNKLGLFNRYSPKFDENRTIQLLKNIGEPFSNLLDGGRPKIKTLDQETRFFVDFLEKKDLISVSPIGDFVRLNPKKRLTKLER